MEKSKYYELFNKLSQISNENEYLDELIKIIKQILYSRTDFVKNSSNDDLRNEFFIFLRKKIESLYIKYKNRSSKISDIIHFIGCGHTSLVFRLENIVLKIGKKSSNIHSKKYNFDCLIPVFDNQSFQISNKEYYSIQITPLVDTNNLTEEELYCTYKRLRSLGYIWNDPTLDNIGRIIDDIEFEGKTYKNGDVVIIDLEDFVYVGENTPPEVLDDISISGYNQKTYIYEVRYMEENSSPKKII